MPHHLGHSLNDQAFAVQGDTTITTAHHLDAALVEVQDPEYGPLPMPAAIPSLSRTPGRIRWSGEQLGAGTAEILSGQLGLTEHEIEELRAEGAI